MYIFNESRTVLDSAIKKEHFTNSFVVSISSIKGNSIIIYIVEPNNFGAFQSSISIEKLIAGFQEIVEVGEIGSNQLARASINCDPMVQCQPSKIPFAGAVARMATQISSTKVGFCTGTLINNEENNGRAYFLTAFHCIDVNKNNVIDQSEIDLLASTVFQFQFWRNQCNGTINNRGLEFSGATLRASSQSTDVALLELLNPPGIGDLVNYAGWNRQTSSPSDNSSFILHHPQTQDMRITSTINVKNWLWNSNYWTSHYYSGTVDKGSSGSALMNENGQIVGQLKSGWSNCNFTDFGDRYGKFDKSWNGAGLQAWLSPTGNMSVNTLILSPATIQGPSYIECNTGTYVYSVPSLLGCTYNWTVPSALNIISGQGTASIFVTRNSTMPGGNVEITVTINDSKGRNRTLSVAKTVTVGIPDNTQLSIWSSSNTVCPNLAMPFITLYNNRCALLNAEWQVTSSDATINYNSGFPCINENNTGVAISFPTYGTYSVITRVQNSCGWSGWSQPKYIQVSCGYGYSVSPNPASNTVTVQSDQKTNATITQLSIFDNNGNLKKQSKFGTGTRQAQMNIYDLNTGIYFIEISSGNKKERQQLIIQK